jgi:hypothetical protein
VGDASNVNVTDGFLSPGDFDNIADDPFVEEVGTLTVNGDVTFAALGNLNMQIGATSDLLVTSGAIDLGSSILNLNLGAFMPHGIDSYTLISNTGAGAISNEFGTVNVNGVAAANDDLDLNGQTYHLSYAGGVGGNDLMLLPGAAPVGVPGDYNNDMVVDAADYVMFRAFEGTSNDLSGNGQETPPSNGIVDEDDYDYWTAHFGNPGGGGSGSVANAVPEPGTMVLVVFAMFGMLIFANRRSMN